MLHTPPYKHNSDRRDHVGPKEMEATTAATLPNDVILEILARLPDEALLFRCAATCKLWSSLVADPSFLRRRWPDNSPHPSSLVGFFPRNGHIRRETMEPIPRGPRSASSGLRRRPLGSLPPEADGLFDRARPLASRGGLLLLHFIPRHARVHDSRPTSIHFAVCNLLAGSCEVLPPLQCKSVYDSVKLEGFGIIAGTDFCSGVQQQRRPLRGFSALFKVLLIGSSHDGMRHYLYTFSSDQPSWSAPSSFLDCLKHHKYLMMIQQSAVVRQGTAHWLCWDFSDVYNYDVNAETGRASLAKLPVPVGAHYCFLPYSTPKLTVGVDGALLLVRLHTEGVWIEIWTRQDGRDQSVDSGSAGWLRTGVVEIEQPKQKLIQRPECVCLGEKSGTMLLVDQDGRAHLVDLETGTVEEMTGRFKGKEWMTAVAVEIDWPALFLSRLSGQRRCYTHGQVLRPRLMDAIVASRGWSRARQLLCKFPRHIRKHRLMTNRL